MTNFNPFIFLNCKKQTTIKKVFQIEGQALISGKKVVVKCEPAKENTGIIFKTDQGQVEAICQNINKSQFHTTELLKNDIKVITIEHITSAFYGMGVDNVLINISGDCQLPIMDGSSKQYVEEIQKSGIKKLRKNKKTIKIISSFVVKNEESDSFALIFPSTSFTIRAVIDFKNIIGVQDESFVFNSNNYVKNIGLARTFFIDNFSYKKWYLLRKQFSGLPINPKDSNIVVYNKNRFLSASRCKNEQVKHKILDFIGDFSLLNCGFIGEIILYKPSHKFNHKIVEEIIKKMSEAGNNRIL